MSGKFDGFSREDINKISGKPIRTFKPSFTGHGIRRLQESKSMTSNSNSATMVQKKNTKNSNATPTTDTQYDNEKHISETSLASLQEAVHFRPLSAINKQKITSDNVDESILNEDNCDGNDSSILTDPTIEQKPAHSSPFRGISLKDFENNRKLREEQNKQKKELLYKAIEKHTQKTAAEAKKIEEIKIELSKLDDDLATDVAILRKQIEAACMQYDNIEKHYTKAEAIFLKAKLDLYNAFEKKELLTEHLCTVITHNEDRKAKKLSELMSKVGLASDVDAADIADECDVVDK